MCLWASREPPACPLPLWGGTTLQNLPLLRLLLLSLGGGLIPRDHSRWPPVPRPRPWVLCQPSWALSPPVASPFRKGVCLPKPPHLPQGPAPSPIPIPEWLFMGRGSPLPPVQSPPSLLRSSQGMWTRRCSNHPASMGTTPFWVAPCWAAPLGRALAWELLGGFPAAHLAP